MRKLRQGAIKHLAQENIVSERQGPGLSHRLLGSTEFPQPSMLSQGCSHILVIFTTSVIDDANKNTFSLFKSPYYQKVSEG